MPEQDDSKRPLLVSWKRGVAVLWKTYAVFILFGVIVLRPAQYLIAFTNDLGGTAQDVASVLVFCLLGMLAFFVLPIVVSKLQMDRNSIQEEVVADMESDIDALAKHVEISWDDHFLTTVQRHLEEGDKLSARRVFHANASVPWDAVDSALANWRVTLAKTKLSCIRKSVVKDENSAS